MALVISGAAGQLGRRTAELVLDAVDPADVVLLTRTPGALDDLAARGATVRAGDFDDAAGLTAALAGGTRLLLISTDAVGRRIEQHRNAIAAAKAAGVEHVAYTSMPHPVEGNPAAVTPEHRATEAALAASGLAWTVLRNALYSEYQIPELEHARTTGSFAHNRGTGRTAYVSREDCAAAAAAVLTGGPEHAGRVYDITGPALLDAQDLAGIYGAVAGAPVGAQAVDDATLIAALTAGGLPDAAAALIASFGTAIREGYLDALSGDVQALTGRAPAPLADVLRR
jgi:NAD(P)H dehydrogenase (quinone)